MLHICLNPCSCYSWPLLKLTDGAIPSGFCTFTAFSIDVVDTDIHCYTGCLTSASVAISPQLDICHDGSIMREFLTVVCASLLVAVVFSAVYYGRQWVSLPDVSKSCCGTVL